MRTTLLPSTRRAPASRCRPRRGGRRGVADLPDALAGEHAAQHGAVGGVDARTAGHLAPGHHGALGGRVVDPASSTPGSASGAARAGAGGRRPRRGRRRSSRRSARRRPCWSARSAAALVPLWTPAAGRWPRRALDLHGEDAGAAVRAALDLRVQALDHLAVAQQVDADLLAGDVGRERPARAERATRQLDAVGAVAQHLAELRGASRPWRPAAGGAGGGGVGVGVGVGTVWADAAAGTASAATRAAAGSSERFIRRSRGPGERGAWSARPAGRWRPRGWERRSRAPR